MANDVGSAGAVAAAALVVPIVMRALARLYPAAPPPTDGLTLEALAPRYRRWDVGISLAAFAGAVPIGLGIWWGLRALSGLRAALLPPSEVTWVATPYYWALPALLLGIVAALPVGALLGRILLRERYAEYLAYGRLRSGMDLARVARLLAVVVGALCAPFIFLGLDWSVRLSADGLAVNRYLGVGEERYAFRDVAEIRTAAIVIAPNGNRVGRREWSVRFADGRRWSTNNLLSETGEAEKGALAALLSARSGVAIEEVDALGGDDL